MLKYRHNNKHKWKNTLSRHPQLSLAGLTGDHISHRWQKWPRSCSRRPFDLLRRCTAPRFHFALPRLTFALSCLFTSRIFGFPFLLAPIRYSEIPLWDCALLALSCRSSPHLSPPLLLVNQRCASINRYLPQPIQSKPTEQHTCCSQFTCHCNRQEL
jgi:hypothetical protein